MLTSHQFLTMTVCWVGLNISLASAETSPIYNETCWAEIVDFQQASNNDHVKHTQHALLLCLADNAYAAENQSLSAYESWSNTVHFRVFAKDLGVEIGDMQPQMSSQIFNKWNLPPTIAGGFSVANRGGQCACSSTVPIRSPGDPTSPQKNEKLDVFITFSLNDVISGGTEDVEQIKGVLNQMGTQTNAPFRTEQQIANLIVQMADVDLTDWGATYAADPGDQLQLSDVKINGWSAEPEVDISSPYTFQKNTAPHMNCECPQVRIPIKRSGGDAVPSPKYEGPEIFFQADNFNALLEAFQFNPIDFPMNPVHGGQ